MSSPQAKSTKVNKPTKLEERSSDCPFHRDGHVPQCTLCWYYDVNEATPEAGNGLFLAGNITGADYHWCPFQLLGSREVIRVTPNLHLASRSGGTAGQRCASVSWQTDSAPTEHCPCRARTQKQPSDSSPVPISVLQLFSQYFWLKCMLHQQVTSSTALHLH